jgi:hypothetical protein
MRPSLAALAFTLSAAVSPLAAALAAPFHTPIPADQMGGKLDPGYHHPRDADLVTPAQWAAFEADLAAGRIETLPHWKGSFAISGQTYGYTLLGGAPADGGTTVIPTVIVPIRLTVSDYSVDGKHPLVLDGTKAVASMLASPIFQASAWPAGNLQFEDAMLRTEFPTASGGWRTQFSPSVAAPIDIVAPAGAVKVYKSKSGALLGVIVDDSIIDRGRDSPIPTAVRAASPQTYVVFVTYNALENAAFGYHSDRIDQKSHTATIYTYTSWLVGVDDLFTIPSPDADTLAHEISEATHDPLGTSRTLLWGDAFRKNRCFQTYIETGDAVEDAPAPVQNWRQPIEVDGKEKLYTLQTEALLPWFERQSPSTALGGAYSFPNTFALTTAAPLTCVK